MGNSYNTSKFTIIDATQAFDNTANTAKILVSRSISAYRAELFLLVFDLWLYGQIRKLSHE